MNTCTRQWAHRKKRPVGCIGGPHGTPKAGRYRYRQGPPAVEYCDCTCPCAWPHGLASVSCAARPRGELGGLTGVAPVVSSAVCLSTVTAEHRHLSPRFARLHSPYGLLTPRKASSILRCPFPKHRLATAAAQQLNSITPSFSVGFRPAFTLNERTQGPRNFSGLPLRGPTCPAIVQYTCATVDEIKCGDKWLLRWRCLIRSPISQQGPDCSRHLVGQCDSDYVRRTSRQQEAQSLGQMLRT
ncbi:hypothetical protein R69749_08220 [Paraburkholderia domus]|nr:hypothetical protein R69749_08220 [Paraburkholderia domus]